MRVLVALSVLQCEMCFMFILIECWWFHSSYLRTELDASSWCILIASRAAMHMSGAVGQSAHS